MSDSLTWVDRISLSTRTRNLIIRYGLLPDQIRQMPDDALLRLENCGRRTIKELREIFGTWPQEDRRMRTMNELDRDMTVKEWRAKQISEEKIDRETGEVVEAPPVPARAEMRPLASPDVTEVCKALARAQGTMEAPQRTKKGKIEGTARSGRDYSFEYAYAPLEEILRVLRKPFLESDLCLQQYIVTRAGQWFVRTILWHQSGQWLSSDYPVFAEQMTGQKFAGAVTYAKRQGLCLVCAIAPEDDQDLQEQAEAPPAHAQRATRANPAAAPPASPETDRARAAYKKIQQAIDEAKTPRALQNVYDGVIDEWGEGYQFEASLVGELNGSSLDLLKRRLKGRLQAISQQTAPPQRDPADLLGTP